MYLCLVTKRLSAWLSGNAFIDEFHIFLSGKYVVKKVAALTQQSHARGAQKIPRIS